jgi:putative PIN family toxin of toxin-antitoxin system
MHVVIDTNTVISGLLWGGPPRLVLDAARVGRISLFTTRALLAELDEVLHRRKFAHRLTLIDANVEEVIESNLRQYSHPDCN